MEQLKSHRFIESEELWNDANAGSLYYLKSEADDQIEDLKKKNVELERDILWHQKEIGGRFLLKDENDRLHNKVRYNKYKRCIKTAEWCWERRWRVEFDYAFWHRWGKRWFEIAETFKEK